MGHEKTVSLNKCQTLICFYGYHATKSNQDFVEVTACLPSCHIDSGFAFDEFVVSTDKLKPTVVNSPT